MRNYGTDYFIDDDVISRYEKDSYDEEIIKTASRLDSLKKSRKELIETIKKNVYWLNNSKPNNYKNIVEAALHYFFKEIPRSYGASDYNVSQSKVWKTEVTQPYYLAYSDKFKTDNGTYPIRIGELKNFHYLVDIKELWKNAIENDLTTKSLTKFTSDTKGKNLYRIFQSSSHKNPYTNRIFIVNCKEIGVKDVVIVLPK
jgi:hypothetical protein